MKITDITIRQDKNGNDYKCLSLSGSKGEIKVNVFQKHPAYPMVSVGNEIADENIVQDGKFYNYLAPAELKPASQPRGAGFGVKAAQERKAESIATAQGRKENAIELAASQRDATLVVTTFYKDIASNLPETERDQYIAEKITNWREWYMEHHGDASDPTLKQPF